MNGQNPKTRDTGCAHAADKVEGAGHILVSSGEFYLIFILNRKCVFNFV